MNANYDGSDRQKVCFLLKSLELNSNQKIAADIFKRFTAAFWSKMLAITSESFGSR